MDPIPKLSSSGAPLGQKSVHLNACGIAGMADADSEWEKWISDARYVCMQAPVCEAMETLPLNVGVKVECRR